MFTKIIGVSAKKYEIPIDGIVKISNKVYTDTENCKKNITIIGTNTNFKEDLLINDIIFLYKRKVSKADANTIIKKNCGQKSGIVKVGAVFITNIVSNTEFCGIELYDTLETSNISCKFSDKKLVNDKYFDVDGQCCENNLSLINDDEYYIIRGTISGENISIFNKEPYYITMHIDELPRYKSLTKPNDDAFALIPLHSDYLNINPTVGVYNKTFVPPLAYLDKLTISFKKYNGELYDFGGINHYFVLAITYLER